MGNQIDVDFFEKSLRSEGLHDVDVSMQNSPTKMGQTIRVTKRVNGEKVCVSHEISEHMINQINMSQHLATLAAQTSRQFEEYLTEQHEWGENSVRLDLNECYDATCFRCGAEASMDDLASKPVSLSETAVPQPPTDNYQSLPKYKLRLTLLALLKRECEPICPNSPRDRKV